MYCLSDKQIDYILDDIGARGVGMESLQQNLLDHICCIIEQNLGEDGDFESFYQKTIRTFYKDALWEIEEETLILLTNKNYYTMKKTMVTSGTIAAALMCIGILFKFMHWPGAGICIVLGIFTSSFIFLPLFFTVKVKEQQSRKDKAVIGLGVTAGILMSLSVLFKVQHWPHANQLSVLSLMILAFLFLPVYFYSGIRDAERKVNTITVSILIIMICGLWLTLIRSPRSTLLVDLRDTGSFVATEQIVASERNLLKQKLRGDSGRSSTMAISQEILQLCQELKEHLLVWETGQKAITPDFEDRQILLQDRNGVDPFTDETSHRQMVSLIRLVEEYNQVINTKKETELNPIPTRSSLIDFYRRNEKSALSTMAILNQLSQVQMFVLQNEQQLLAGK